MATSFEPDEKRIKKTYKVTGRFEMYYKLITIDGSFWDWRFQIWNRWRIEHQAWRWSTFVTTPVTGCRRHRKTSVGGWIVVFSLGFLFYPFGFYFTLLPFYFRVLLGISKWVGFKCFGHWFIILWAHLGMWHQFGPYGHFLSLPLWGTLSVICVRLGEKI